MSSTIQSDHAHADDMVLPPRASMRQWDFDHLPLDEQLRELGKDATPPSFSIVYYLNKWSRELPDAPCLMVPNATASSYITFSYAQYDAATNHIARYWASELNPSWLDASRTRAMAALDAPVAILIKDLPTSHALIVAFHKLRIPVLLISTRNSPAGVSHLVTTANVGAILIEDSLRSLLEPQVAHIPTYSVLPVNPEELLQVPAVPPIPHCADVDGEDIAVIVHSSGTTGLPKLFPTPYRAMYFSALCFDITDGYHARGKSSTLLMVLPIFHAFGARMMVCTFVGAKTLALPLTTTWPVSAAQAANSLEQSKARILCTVPAIIEQLASNTSTHAALAGLNMLYYSGAPLSVETVQLLRGQIGIKQMVNMYGSSEGGLVMVGCVDANHGDSDSRGDEMMLAPLANAHMEQFDKDLYELVFHRDSPQASKIQTDEQGWYHTGDLFRNHGNEHYVLIGRKDDTLVHSNGEKTSAQPMENSLVGSEPVILRALVVGASHPCTAALIELDPEVAALLSQQEIDARIANAVDLVNITAPQHSRLLYPDMVTILPLGGPSLLTTDKGSIRRRQCNELFAREIDALYNAIDDSKASQPATMSTAIAKYSASELEEKLRELLIQLLPQSSAELLKMDDKWRELDFFANLGIDSLQATHARGRIAKAFGFRLSAESVFTYSTIEQLAELMLKQSDATAATSSQVAIDVAAVEAQNNRTLEYIRKFTDFSDITVRTGGDVISRETEAGVLLTGATGSLGAWVLDSLVQRPVDRVKTVFVLVRGGADKAVERVRESLRQRHCNVTAFDAALDAGRVVVLGNYDTNDVKFGQTAEVYRRLEQEVSVIMHVAWSVGFNKPVQAYADQMFNVAQFARFAAVPAIHSPSQPKRIVFTSSISVALAYPSVCGGSNEVPEDELDIRAASAVAGYSRSKFAAESILMDAYRQFGAPVKVVRVGQIAGDREHGVWTNATEMNAMLTYAPTTVHALPSSGVATTVDWVPVDDVAKALLEFALDTPRTASMYNLVNPKTISWPEFVDILRRALPTTKFDVLPYSKWVEGLSKDLDSGESEEDIKKHNPFFELIPFLQQSVGNDSADADDKALVIITDAAQRDSSVIRGLPAIDDALVRKYLRGWQRAGLIDSHVEIAG